MKSQIIELNRVYKLIKTDIEVNLENFRKNWIESNEVELFIELVFCLLTPQSRAKTCWNVVENLVEKDLILNGQYDEINRELNIVRFKNRKTEYILLAREKFLSKSKISIRGTLSQFDNIYLKRDWLVESIKGFGYKEASHFLRNIGLGNKITILDRHILKNLKLYNVIDEIPYSLTKKKYHNIEAAMMEFARGINIPLDHLDLVLWYKESGEIFK